MVGRREPVSPRKRVCSWKSQLGLKMSYAVKGTGTMFATKCFAFTSEARITSAGEIVKVGRAFLTLQARKRARNSEGDLFPGAHAVFCRVPCVSASELFYFITLCCRPEYMQSLPISVSRLRSPLGGTACGTQVPI